MKEEEEGMMVTMTVVSRRQGQLVLDIHVFRLRCGQMSLQ
jgi:hypothetical protein